VSLILPTQFLSCQPDWAYPRNRPVWTGWPMETLATKIGKAARTARAALGLTQADAAEQIGISTEFYARIERGGATPSVPTLAKMAAALETTADRLLGRGESSTAAQWARANGATSEEPEIRRLVRRLRGAHPRTLRLLNLLAAALEKTTARGTSQGRARPNHRHAK
jgi:transcriptional regulator with XRE-family HTH domain